MTMPLHSLKYPSNMLGYTSKHRNQDRIRALVMPPSSIILQTDASGNLPDSKKTSASVIGSINGGDSGGSLLSQANAVGIIGGVSMDSTLSFVQKLVKWSSKDKEGGLPFVLCSDPVLNNDLLSYERSYFSTLNSRNEHFKKTCTPIVENLKRKRIFLENSGARCIVMPCHVSHSWHDEVSKGCSVPFLHMGECVARELKEAKLRPLEAGSPLRIGVLGTSATLAAGFYQEKLQNEGFEVVLPDKATMEHTVVPAIEALSRKDMEGAQNLLKIALQVLLVRAVNTVILASDEMREILPWDDLLLRKCIDPMDALARSTIKHAQSGENST